MTPPLLDSRNNDRHMDHLGEDEDVVHAWSINGRFSSNPVVDASLPLNRTNPTFVSDPTVNVATPHEPRRPPLVANDPSSSQDDSTFGDNFIVTMLLPILFFLLLLTYCQRRNRPGVEHHRGHLIRARAERIWEAQRVKKERFEATPEDRMAQIQQAVVARQVLCRDHLGRCVLGPEVDLSNTPDDASNQAEAGELSQPVEIKANRSMDTADTFPLDLESDASQAEANDSNSLMDDDDDDHVCPICLDGFSVGDTVVYSRRLTCGHAFHAECLLQWLLDRRENECPSCRAPLLKDDDQIKEDGGNDTDETTVETDASQGSSCDIPHGNETTDGFVDLEQGQAAAPEQEPTITRYYIAKGRIVEEQVPYQNQREQTTVPTTPRSHHLPSPCCPAAPRKSIDAATAQRISLSGQVPQQLFPKRPRSLSVDEATRRNTTQEASASDDALATPIPLVRVSQSFPTPTQRNHTTRPSHGVYDRLPSSEARSQPLYRDDQTSQFSGLFSAERDGCSECSSTDEDSDDDAAIRRMVARIAGSKIVSL